MLISLLFTLVVGYVVFSSFFDDRTKRNEVKHWYDSRSIGGRRNLHCSRGRFLLFKEDCNMSVDRKTNTTITEDVVNSDSASSMGETSAPVSSMSTERLGHSLVPTAGGSKTKEKPPRFRNDVSLTN